VVDWVDDDRVVVFDGGWSVRGPGAATRSTRRRRDAPAQPQTISRAVWLATASSVPSLPHTRAAPWT
jgi:hypothetical protein